MCKKLIFLTCLVLVLGLLSNASADLVVHWALEEGAGTTATDSSGNGNDGTFNGAPEWVEGKLGGGLHVRGDAEQDYVVFTLPGGDTVWQTGTIAIWVKLDSLGQDQYSSAFTNYNPNSAGIQFDVDGGNPGNFRLNPGGQFFGPATTEWAHLALTFEDGNGTFYYNSEEATTAALSDSQRTFNEFAIGINRNHSNWMAAIVDELRVYDHALTGDEIRAIMTSAAGRLPRARRPDPADGTVLEQTWVSLKWGAGDGAVTHDLYFGTNPEDVNSGAEDTYVGNLATTQQVVGFPGFPAPEGLTPGTTYYWRVDEVNDADPNSPWKGDVWSFWIPPKTTYNADPADGVHFVKTDADISWSAGFDGKLGHLYFGQDPAEVEAGTGGVYKGPIVGTTYDPGLLEEDKTYYWRVDQFDGIETHEGNVWSFTTVPEVVVTDPFLLGWWTLDEGEGTTAVDWSGHGSHGSFVGEPQWVDGYQGMALGFSDRGQYIDCVDDAGAGVTADFTIAAWVKMTPANSGKYMGIAGKLTSPGSEYYGFAIVRYSDNDFRLWVADGGDTLTNSRVSSDANCTDIDWHHVAGVREGNSNFLYVDGVRQAGMSITDFVPSDDFFHIGRQYAHYDDRYWNGLIDDVRVYNKALTDEQIAEVMLGDNKMASDPVPDRDAVLDIRDISSLSWSRGNTAASHDMYFGTDRDAVAGADRDSPEFRGNQAGTSLSLADLVEFGGGDYYWRIDEVEANGTVHAGTIWKFTVPDQLIVDNFESYNDIDPPDPASHTIYGSWADGYGIPTNGALTANEFPPYAEQITIRNGFQSMEYRYDTNMMISESTLTLTERDWTVEGVTTLSLWFKGLSSNAAERMFVALNGNAVAYHDDPAASQIVGWNEWAIDLTRFADQGVDLTNVTTMTIGFGTKNSPAAGGTGTVYFDDIGLIR
jgi:hypothetical protein